MKKENRVLIGKKKEKKKEAIHSLLLTAYFCIFQCNINPYIQQELDFFFLRYTNFLPFHGAPPPPPNLTLSFRKCPIIQILISLHYSLLTSTQSRRPDIAAKCNGVF